MGSGSFSVSVGDELDFWERRWAPYDEATYRAVLDALRPQDRVLEIGAGDLRLARRMARRVQRVYALELQLSVLRQGLQDGPLPPNLHVICGDARLLPFPPVTVGVLLMRHCTHFTLYRTKLQQAGAERLITNARWRMGVEVIDLTCPGMDFKELRVGWYACRCGRVGFKEGPADWLTPPVLERIHEVQNCPFCKGGKVP